MLAAEVVPDEDGALGKVRQVAFTTDDAVELSMPLFATAENENSMPLYPVGVIKQVSTETWQFTLVEPFVPVMV